jgi:4-hydroxy-tetrahydrodipicolinate reductase
MQIAIIGYGKMGKLIGEIAEERGHQIVLKVGRNNVSDFNSTNIKKADIAIEFSTPEAGYENVKKCLRNGVSIISGTTGWNDKLIEIQDLAIDKEVGFIYASNFSLGVNLFFALNSYLAKLMEPHSNYATEIEEIHHTSKKDSPSGTAITLAEQIIANSEYENWDNINHKDSAGLPIISKRIDPAPGTHKVTYSSVIDDISIQHTAHTRKGFALGAVLAAEWLFNKKGVYTMKDVLGLS